MKYLRPCKPQGGCIICTATLDVCIYIFLLKLLEDCRFQIIEPWHIFKDLLTALFRNQLLPFIPVMVKGKGKVYQRRRPTAEHSTARPSLDGRAVLWP